MPQPNSLISARSLLVLLVVVVFSMASLLDLPAYAADAKTPTPVPTTQETIDRVELMPNRPMPFKLKDFKATARGLDKLLFDFDARGQYLPVIWWDDSKINTPMRGFGFPSFVGRPDQSSGMGHESITTMGATGPRAPHQRSTAKAYVQSGRLAATVPLSISASGASCRYSAIVPSDAQEHARTSGAAARPTDTIAKTANTVIRSRRIAPRRRSAVRVPARPQPRRPWTIRSPRRFVSPTDTTEMTARWASRKTW